MKIVHSSEIAKALDNIGIDVLTSERCKFSMRLLVDYTEAGAHLLEAFFGVAMPRGNNANHGERNDPHVGSLMLPREVLTPLLIFAFALTHHAVMIEKYPKSANLRGYNIIAFDNDGELQERVAWYNSAFDEQLYQFVYGDPLPNNVHAMWGF